VFNDCSFMDAKRKRGSSWIWNSLLVGRDIIRENGRWAIGSGKMVNVSSDHWLADGSLAQLSGS
jgi:hypothetical protein